MAAFSQAAKPSISMGKEKKIGFNYYLNTKLNSQVLDGQKHYPVYVRITYDRKNTMFFFPLDYKASYVTESEFESFFVLRNDPQIKKRITQFEDEISKIMRFEIKVLGEKYSFKNLSSKPASYQNSLIREIEKFTSNQLIKEGYELSSNEEILSLKSGYLFLSELYTLIKTMFSDAPEMLSDKLILLIKAYIGLLVFSNKSSFDHFIKVIDWVNGDLPIQYKNSIWEMNPDLKSYFPNEAPSSPLWTLLKDFPLSKLEIHKYLNIIDKAIVEMQS